MALSLDDLAQHGALPDAIGLRDGKIDRAEQHAARSRQGAPEPTQLLADVLGVEPRILDPENRGALLRRRSSIQSWFQLADVFVDGQRVGRWRTIRVNPYRGWIDTDFEIPQAFTDEKAAIDVEIRPVADYFNAFRYEAFSYR